jgi:DNA repair photolyase
VVKDFDFVQQHRDRVLMGLSLTAPVPKDGARCPMTVVEPFASPNSERIDAMREAKAQGLRTYGMLCPLLPGIADSREAVTELVDVALACGAEEIFAEPVNARGPALKDTQEALMSAGFIAEAKAVESIRKQSNRSSYSVRLLATLQDVLRERKALHKLKYLLYPAHLQPADQAWVKAHMEGVVWLAK